MIKATYGHGTHNDFVLVFDENDEIRLHQIRSSEFVIARMVWAVMA